MKHKSMIKCAEKRIWLLKAHLLQDQMPEQQRHEIRLEIEELNQSKLHLFLDAQKAMEMPDEQGPSKTHKN